MEVVFEVEGRKFSMEIGFFDTILEIKEKIEKQEGIPVSQQTLVFNGQVLENDLEVDNSELVEGCDIDLIIEPPDENPPPEFEKILQIVVKFGITTKGTTVYGSDTVEDLRERLPSDFPPLPYKYFVVHKNTSSVLQDDRSFQWHNVCEGDVVEIKSWN